MSAFNFPSASKKNSLTPLEWAAIGHLIQQRQQIGLQKKSLVAQQAMLQQQAKGNKISQDQLEHMRQIEQTRQLEKLTDLWTEEFKHRGMSPLKAHNQALAELKLQSLLVQADEAYLRFAKSRGQEINSLRYHAVKAVGPKFNKRIFFAIVLCIFIFGAGGSSNRPDAIRVISQILGFMPLLSVLVFLVQKSNAKSNVMLLPEEHFEARFNSQQSPARNRLKSDFQIIEEELAQLPKSELSDDSDFRKLVTSAVVQD